MRGLWSKGWIISHLFVFICVVTMANLGFWQLRRLDDRQASNAVISERLETQAVHITTTAAINDLEDYTPVVATGQYLDSELLIGHRSYAGQSGYWLVTPFQIKVRSESQLEAKVDVDDDANDDVIAVVRGWIPRRHVAGLDSRPTDAPTGIVHIYGAAFESQTGGQIVTEASTSNGESYLAEISKVDLDAIRTVLEEAVLAGDVANRWIQLSHAQDPAQDLPVIVSGPDLSDGPHLSYAFQWFFFAGSAVVVYALILRRKLRSSAKVRQPDQDVSSKMSVQRCQFQDVS